MELLTTLEYFFDMTHIPIRVCDGEKTVKEFAAGHFEPNPAVFLAASVISSESNIDMTINKDFLMCGYIRDKNSGLIIYIGPVTEYPCTRKMAKSILKQMEQDTNRTENLIMYMERIPQLSLTRFLKNMLFLNYILNNESPPEQYLDDKIATLIGPEIDIHLSNTVVHNTQEAEDALLQLIEHGKVNELAAVLRNEKSIKGSMGLTANDSLRAYKNIFVTSATIASRTAVKGGLDYETSLDASDKYLQEMESMDNYDDIHTLWRQMMLDFTSQVAKLRRLNPTSHLVHQVAGYVTEHIYERILIEDIAERYDYNRSYLCRAFKKDTGKNLSVYINEAKMEEAKYLLGSTEKPVAEIAMALGFSTQNHFQTVFKKMTTKTPAQYRKDTD